MIPYSSFLYFGLTLYFVLPLLAGGVLLKSMSVRKTVLIVSLVMLIVQYWPDIERMPGFFVREIWVVLLFTCVEYGIARTLLRVRRKGTSTLSTACGAAFALIPILCSRFMTFGVTGVSPLFGFLGISYVTFRSLDVVIGIHDGVITSLSFFDYAAYVLFFPTISSGPIDRYSRFVKDLGATRERQTFFLDLDSAVEHLFRGFLYKYLVAAWISEHWMTPLLHAKHFGSTVSFMYAYSFYLFFDFAGYSAFAIAFSKLLGIHTPENFAAPFLSTNIKEFWNRWHISLSWWFRDHIYTRFVMAATRGKWFKSRYTGSYLGFLLTMGLMGLWHGSEVHYVVYGLYHALLLIGYDVFHRWNKTRSMLSGRIGKVISIALTFNLICFGLLLFSGKIF